MKDWPRELASRSLGPVGRGSLLEISCPAGWVSLHDLLLFFPQVTKPVARMLQKLNAQKITFLVCGEAASLTVMKMVANNVCRVMRLSRVLRRDANIYFLLVLVLVLVLVHGFRILSLESSFSSRTFSSCLHRSNNNLQLLKVCFGMTIYLTFDWPPSSETSIKSAVISPVNLFDSNTCCLSVGFSFSCFFHCSWSIFLFLCVSLLLFVLFFLSENSNISHVDNSQDLAISQRTSESLQSFMDSVSCYQSSDFLDVDLSWTHITAQASCPTCSSGVLYRCKAQTSQTWRKLKEER